MVFIEEIIGNDFVIRTLPWRGMAIVYSRGTTDNVPRSTRSVVWPHTSAGPACAGGGTSCVWGSDWGGEGATWIRDAGWGGEDGVVFYRFGWDLVLFGLFLLGGAWLGWGASAPDVRILLVFADAPVCCYKKPKFHELDIRKGIGGVLLKNIYIKIWCKIELPMTFLLQPMYPKKIV